MKTSDNGLKFIMNHEGVRLKAYKPVPTEKYWTIGVGHYGKDVFPEMIITREEALEILAKDIERFEKAVNKLNLNLNQNQFDSLVSFSFNLGEGCLKTLVKGRTLQQIADAILKYNKAGGKVLNGLTKRRKAERELFLKPVNEEKKLPYVVTTKQDLNIRSGAGVNFPKIRVAKKGEKLTVWAIETNGDTQWGKNGKEYFCLTYCI